MENEVKADDVAQREIQQYNTTRVPTFLKWTYLFLPFWGIAFAVVFWNGSHGWFDRGYWHELQVASNTTDIRVMESNTQAEKNEVVVPHSN